MKIDAARPSDEEVIGRPRGVLLLACEAMLAQVRGSDDPDRDWKLEVLRSLKASLQRGEF